MYRGAQITAIIPALNEELAIGRVVTGLLALSNDVGSQLIDLVIVADNGSSDQTAELAGKAGARIVSEPRRGYGAACLAAMNSITGTDLVVFVDGDCSIRLSQTEFLLEAIDNGADLVIGSRCLGTIETGAMTWPQRVGNALVAKLISVLWRQSVTDIGPFRAIRFAALQQLEMEDMAYGWTVEMQVKALQKDFVVREVPVDCLARVGRSKVSGTLRGVIGAALGMLGMVCRLWLEDNKYGIDALSRFKRYAKISISSDSPHY